MPDQTADMVVLAMGTGAPPEGPPPASPEEAVSQAMAEHGDDPAAIVRWLKDYGFELKKADDAAEEGMEDAESLMDADEGMEDDYEDMDELRRGGIRRAMKKHGYDEDDEDYEDMASE